MATLPYNKVKISLHSIDTNDQLSEMNPDVRLNYRFTTSVAVELTKEDYEQICRTFAAIEQKIRCWKNAIALLDEHIMWLYAAVRDYLKVLVRFNHRFSANTYKHDSNVANIRVRIEEIFDNIERRINFFSESHAAYLLKPSPSPHKATVDGTIIRVELRKPDIRRLQRRRLPQKIIIVENIVAVTQKSVFISDINGSIAKLNAYNQRQIGTRIRVTKPKNISSFDNRRPR